MKPLSQTLTQMPPSMTIAVNNQAAALKAAGHDVIALAGGDPDFDTPQHIQEAAFAAIRNGRTHYSSPTKGRPIAVEAIAAKYARESGLLIDAANQVIVTPSGKWAINLALGAILNAGDEVLVLEPVWVSYIPLIKLNGGVPVGVTLNSTDNFRISAELLQEKITPRTKAIIVNSPCNPTGRVLTQAEVDAIVGVAISADLYVIYDELYDHLIFDGRKHIQIAAQTGMQERTILINGLSKNYAMTGWRLGWLVAPEPIINLAAKLNSQTVTCASDFGMDALAAALNGDHGIVREMCDSYRERRDFMVTALNAIDGIECATTDGTFYLLPHFTNTSLSSIEIAEQLVQQAGIVGTPGIAFGAAAEQHVRFSIATAFSDLKRAVKRLAEIVPKL